MEHLAKKLTDYIYEKDNYRRISRNLSVRFSMLLELSVSTICSIIIALFLGMLPECLSFSCSLSPCAPMVAAYI